MTHAEQATEVHVAVVGSSPRLESVTRTFRGVAGVAVTACGATDDDLLQCLARPEIDAIAFASARADLAGGIRRVLLSGRHVFVAMPVALASKQLVSIDELARRRERVVAFDDGLAGDSRIDFVRKMTSGANALWRPRYIRALRTGSHPDETLDELAIGEIGTVLAIAGDTPARVSAIMPRTSDEDGLSDVCMLTLVFGDGLAARIDVSLVEPTLRQEVTVACDDRAMVLDALDLRAPLQIHAVGRHRGPHAQSDWGETVSEHPMRSVADQISSPACNFVAAVRGRDLVASNAQRLAAAALVWEAARTSVSRGGELVAVAERDSGGIRRPELQMIRGGGRRVEGAPAPELTLVRRTASSSSNGPRSA